MGAKETVVILSAKEYSRLLARSNKHYRKMFTAAVACAAYIYTTERRRKNKMRDAIDILAKEIKELKATKGE